MKIAPRRPRPPKTPGTPTSIFDILLANEIAEAETERRRKAISEQETETKIKKPAERLAETRTAQRRENRKSPAALAVSAWATYREARKAGDKAKAGHWKAYAIRNALIAMKEGEGEALPKRLVEAAMKRPPAKAKTRKHYYRVYIYLHGNINDFADRPTKAKAEATKAYRETRKKITCKVCRLNAEHETLTELEKAAIEQTIRYARRRNAAGEKAAEPSKRYAMRLWQAYRAAGGRHPTPEELNDRNESQ